MVIVFIHEYSSEKNLKQPHNLVNTVSMIKRILSFVITLAAVFCVSFSVYAFEPKDLDSYSAFAVKTMKATDTIRSKKQTLEITGTKGLESVLGKETKSFETLYVYVGDKTVEEYSTSKWYYYYQPSWNGRGRGKLHYTRNKITEKSKVDDTLVVARKSDDRLLMLVIQQDSPERKAILEHLGVKEPPAKKSWWARLWSSSDTKTEEYEIESEQLDIPTVSNNKWIQIYFTPGPDCENNIIKHMNQAQNVDIVVYSITNPAIVDSILAAKKRGAKIRVITDRTQAKGKGSLVGKIRDAGIPVVTNIKHKIEHNKFAVFDGKHVVSGSYNWTTNASKYNSENCTFFDQPNKEYSERFKYLWDLYTK